MPRAAFALALISGLAPLLLAQGQPPDPKTASAVELASNYVGRYLKDFSAVVCEERQTQTLIKPNGKVSKTRTIVSDLMFVKYGTSDLPIGFRDVISVDGKSVRDRSDRLRKLFVDNPKTAAEQARAITSESGRYDLANKGTGNSPLLPMFVLAPKLVGRFHFTLNDNTIGFVEELRPTFLAFSRNGKRGDLPARGSAVVDLAKGTVLSATLTAESTEAPVSTTFSVRYADEPAMTMFVPVEMAERYVTPAKPKDDHLETRMTYSAFRRFQVTTSEIIK